MRVTKKIRKYKLSETALALLTCGKPSRDTHEEIEKILDEVEERGIIDEEQGDMIHNIIVLMTPRCTNHGAQGHMVALELVVPRAYRFFRQGGCSRIPIYEENLDNIIGVVHAKACWSWNHGRPTDIRSCAPPYCTRGQEAHRPAQGVQEKVPRWRS